jgi:hypothetical protein
MESLKGLAGLIFTMWWALIHSALGEVIADSWDFIAKMNSTQDESLISFRVDDGQVLNKYSFVKLAHLYL